jgi:rare lipoprotein A
LDKNVIKFNFKTDNSISITIYGETLKYLDRLIFTAILISLLGFSYIVTDTEGIVGGASKIEETLSDSPIIQTIPVITYKPMPDMLTSWYGPGFHGRMTANGEIYDQFDLTAAHKSLKFGTLLRITNESNGKSVIVRINDRGPYVGDRELDLSYGAAKSLGMLKPGVKKLAVELVKVSDSIEILNSKVPM